MDKLQNREFKSLLFKNKYYTFKTLSTKGLWSNTFCVLNILALISVKLQVT